MRIKFHFNVGILKNIKSVFEVLYKLYETIQPKPTIYLIYYNKNSNIRLLFDSQTFPAVISIAAETLTLHDGWCKLNEKMDITSIQILDGMQFMKYFLILLSYNDMTGIVFEIKKEKEIRFIKLNFYQKQQDFHMKIAVQPPKYDPIQIKHHYWINGCMLSQMEFWIQTEPLLNMMRVFAKMRQKQQSNKRLQIQFNFSKNQYYCHITGGNTSFEGNSRGELKSETKQKKYKSMTYYIKVQNSKIVLQIVKKFKELKLMTSQQRELIFIYNKQNIYVCQLRASQWIKLKSFVVEQNYMNITKIEDYE